MTKFLHEWNIPLQKKENPLSRFCKASAVGQEHSTEKSQRLP